MADAWIISGQMAGFGDIFIWAIYKSFGDVSSLVLTASISHSIPIEWAVPGFKRWKGKSWNCQMSCPRTTGESKKECVHWKTEIQIQISSKSWKAFRFTFTEEAWRDHKCTWEVLTGCSQSLKWELLLISSHLAVVECKWCEHETTYRHISVIACGSSVIPRSLTSSSQSPDPLQK